MPLHPQSRAWIEALPTVPPPDPAALRAGMRAQSVQHAGAAPDLPGVRDRSLGGVAVRVYPMGDGPRPTVIVVHGGGWVGGDLETHDVTCRRLASASGWTVVAVDYRRPPEDVFPAALEDVLAVAAALR
nr:alpha/beta hydrolase fold domain-containing protein [Geodermatophilaceae bacterium]